MTIRIRKHTPASTRVERARLLKKARVSSVIELRRKVTSLQASSEQQGIMLRLEGLSFLEGANPKVR